MSTNIAARVNEELDRGISMMAKPFMVSAIFWWAWFHQAGDSFKLFGLEIPRLEAFYVGGAFYIFNFFRLGLAFRRIRDLVTESGDTEVGVWSSSLTSNPSLLNPFSDYRTSSPPAWHSRGGGAILILIWWCCHLSLFRVPVDPDLGTYTLCFVFVGTGAWTALECTRVFRAASRTARSAGSPWGDRWSILGHAALYPAITATICGILVFIPLPYLPAS